MAKLKMTFEMKALFNELSRLQKNFDNYGPRNFIERLFSAKKFECVSKKYDMVKIDLFKEIEKRYPVLVGKKYIISNKFIKFK